jgi:hypothetical protein
MERLKCGAASFHRTATLMSVVTGPALLLLFSACSGQDETRIEPTMGLIQDGDLASLGERAPLSESMARIEGDLALGDRGPAILALHEYLNQYGYFPNPELQRKHPNWTPVVAEGPAAPDVFDERTVAAVQHFQHLMGIEPTGGVDAETLVALQQPRCEFPDGVFRARGSDDGTIEKWALDTPHISGHVCVSTPSDCVDVETCRKDQMLADATVAAMAVWSATTEVSFEHRGLFGCTPVLNIRYRTIDGRACTGAPGANTLADFAATSPARLIRVDVDEKWSNDGTPAADEVDLTSVLIHEIGHALGLFHSSITGVMKISPACGSPSRSLGMDDKIAVSAFHDQWETLPGLARDIAVGDGSGANAAVWVVGDGPADAVLHKWNEGAHAWDWDRDLFGGVRVAVDKSGRPWMVRSNNTVWQRTSSDPLATGVWVSFGTVPAVDIGIGGDDRVWIVAHDGTVRRRNGSVWTTVTTPPSTPSRMVSTRMAILGSRPPTGTSIASAACQARPGRGTKSPIQGQPERETLTQGRQAWSTSSVKPRFLGATTRSCGTNKRGIRRRQSTCSSRREKAGSKLIHSIPREPASRSIHKAARGSSTPT